MSMLSKLFSSNGQRSSINWVKLTDIEALGTLEKASKEKPVAIFKHSTRCSISAMALDRFERDYRDDAHFDPYYLDLIAYRDVSNEIADRYGVTHQSPQVLLMMDGKVIHSSSHNGIDFNEINEVSQNNV